MGQSQSQPVPAVDEPSLPAAEPETSQSQSTAAASSLEELAAEAMSYGEDDNESIDVKGSDCVKPFIALQDCIKANPEAFSKEILDEEENDEEAEKSNLKVRAPAWSRESKPKL